ncbi:RSC chromatin remodeling complex subunit RSC8 [Encephalitozoon cuniculi EcunIII-L]|uniref:Transcription factor of myb-type n=1 Tax=Encephalitozoon cuniculi TaxID=6035 RepID=M1JJ20_ENCCN|nr:transcription factor of myb-type [Encephalitozoon cuniculi]KMV66088.1 RSC chromatin remodeling complex subunit RSC8 [Encephalitozoon cuniculi EcunIII-L]
MENIFPLQESVEIEEIYGSKRPNANPPKGPRAFKMRSGVCSFTDVETYQVKSPGWFRKGDLSALELVSMNRVILGVGKERYMQTRDRIVSGYEDGCRPMTIGKALMLTDMDLHSLLEVFSFVERWGLINHRSLLEKEIRYFETHKGENTSPPEESPKKEGQGKVVDLKEHLEKSSCSCGGRASFFTRSLVLRCAECIDNGVYPQESLKSDFFPATESLLRNMWSRKEEFLLLEGINRFGDEWDSVSRHVQTKTKEQCIFHFLRLPTLENTLSKGDFSIGRLFETADNPVMCLIVLICGIVHPRVASECARTAIKHINRCSQDMVIQHILDAGKEKAGEQRDMEKRKIERLRNVMCEALLNKIKMKIGTYKELYLSTQRVRNELVALRRSLAEEINFAGDE